MSEPLTTEQADRVEAWATVYHEIYRDGHARGTAARGLEGWVDALSGRPIDPEVMWEWRDATVDRIRELRPERILDVGAGTGMIARALAPEVRAYHAIDPTLEGLRDLLDPEQRPEGMTVGRGAAHELSAAMAPGGAPDLVLINSVVQHFPDRAYLDDVLSRALALLAPGGAIFLGDVLDARREARRRREIARRAEPWAGPERLDEVVGDMARRDRELTLDPWSPELMHDVRATVLARCLRDGDLARHRVDVILRPRCDHSAPPQPTRRWEELGHHEAERATRTREALRSGHVVDVPDGLVCPFGPTASEAAAWTPAGTSGVHMHRDEPDRLILTAAPLDATRARPREAT